MDKAKKYILVTGSIRFPIAVGRSVFILTNQGTVQTSPIVTITQVDEFCAIFETRNLNYCVSSMGVPDLMAATAACA